MVRCYGDSKTGLGHLIRSLALSRALAAKGAECVFLVEENIARTLIELDAKAEVISRWPEKADFILYDMPWIEGEWLDAARARYPDARMVGLDFFDYARQSMDLVINLYDHGPKEQKKQNARTRFLTGPQYAIIRDEFKPFRKNTIDVRDTIEKALVTFGSADPQRFSLAILDAFDALPQAAISVVCGIRFDHAGMLRDELLKRGNRFRFLQAPVDMPSLMAEADLVVCGGGTTMLEAAFLGAPAVVLGQTERECAFAKDMCQRGTCVFSLQPGNLSKMLEATICNGYRRKMAIAGRETVKDEGIDRIVAEIIRQAPA